MDKAAAPDKSVTLEAALKKENISVEQYVEDALHNRLPPGGLLGSLLRRLLPLMLRISIEVESSVSIGL